VSFLTITPKGNIGGIDIQATLEEVHTDTLQITEHPVEIGAAVTDHAYSRPSEVVIRCGWSNSSTDALLGSITSLFSGGGLSGASYVDGVYSQLQTLQQSRVPFDITTTRRQYHSMLIVSLNVTTDSKTSNVLMVTATCRQIIQVATQATTLPPRTDQANPASTAQVENAGVQQPQAGATPSPGGAAPAGMWGA